MKGRILAAVLGGLAVAGVIIAGSPAQVPGTETVIATANFRAQTTVSQKPGAEQVGDVRVEISRLVEPGTNVTVGQERFVCTLHYGNTGGRFMLCMDEINLIGRGRIQTQGIIHLGPGSDRLAIVGGTGDFTDVGGTMTRTAPPFITITLNLVYH